MKIGIIVDHPLRDLPALVKLAEEIIFINYSSEIYFVSMYNLGDVLKNLNYNFDAIIFNFYRSSNIKFIKIAKNKKIKVIVYDQEGTGGNDGNILIELVRKNYKYLNLVDLYLFWGKKQLKKFKKTFKSIKPKKMAISGWLSLDIIYDTKIKPSDKNYFLINTNFPVSDPKFNSVQKEIKSISSSTGVKNTKEILNVINTIKRRKEKFIYYISKLLNEFKNEKFIVRVHPYENIREYLYLPKKFKNCRLENYKDINKALINTKALIHIDCTTAVNANYLKIPNLSISWILEKDEHLNKICKNVSTKCNNYQDLKKKLSDVICNKKNRSKKNLDLLEKYYGIFDGKRCVETAKKIQKLINNNRLKRINPLVQKSNNFFFIYYFKYIFYKKIIKFIKLMLNGNYERGKIHKKFDEFDVKKYLKNNTDLCVKKVEDGVILLNK